MASTLDRTLVKHLNRVLLAIRDDEKAWRRAKRDSRVVLKELGVAIAKNLSVTFLDVEQVDDGIEYVSDRQQPVLRLPMRRRRRPRCERVVRVCETQFVEVSYPGVEEVKFRAVKNCVELCGDGPPIPWPLIPAED